MQPGCVGASWVKKKQHPVALPSGGFLQLGLVLRSPSTSGELLPGPVVVAVVVVAVVVVIVVVVVGWWH